MTIKHILLPVTTLVVGGVMGYFLSSKVKERREVNFMDISEIEVFCKQHGDCDHCPLLDKDADACIMHCSIPSEWDNNEIAAIIRKETNNGSVTGEER